IAEYRYDRTSPLKSQETQSGYLVSQYHYLQHPQRSLPLHQQLGPHLGNWLGAQLLAGPREGV
ncbi:MAG: hypothetical protein ACOVNV_12385, partial [Pirellulaceae bacterium]